MGYTMKGSPVKLGTIQGTSSHASALKDLGHGGHKGLTKEEAAKRTHGGKMSKYDKDARKKKSKRNLLTLSTRRKEDEQMYKRLEKERKAAMSQEEQDKEDSKERDKAETKVAKKALKGTGSKAIKSLGEKYLHPMDLEALENERKQYEAMRKRRSDPTVEGVGGVK